MDLSAVTGLALPTRARIESYPIALGELHASAQVWRTAADRIESATDAYVSQITAPGGTDWTGDAADTAADAAYADRGVVYGAAEAMRALARAAELGAANIGGAHDRVCDAITAAEADGFAVGDDLSVRDTRRWNLDTVRARNAAATEHGDFITRQAHLLAAEDHDVAATLADGGNELGGLIPASWRPTSGPDPATGDRTIQAAGWKTDGGPGIDGNGFTPAIPGAPHWTPPKPQITPAIPGDTPGTGPQSIGGIPVPAAVKEHEKPLPAPPPPPPAPPRPPWQGAIDDLQGQLSEQKKINADQAKTISDMQKAGQAPNLKGGLVAIGSGCAGAGLPVAAAGAIVGPFDLPLTAGACALGGAGGLASYLTGAWVGNAVDAGS